MPKAIALFFASDAAVSWAVYFGHGTLGAAVAAAGGTGIVAAFWLQKRARTTAC